MKKIFTVFLILCSMCFVFVFPLQASDIYVPDELYTYSSAFVREAAAFMKKYREGGTSLGSAVTNCEFNGDETPALYNAEAQISDNYQTKQLIVRTKYRKKLKNKFFQMMTRKFLQSIKAS